jgi:hypothetical protein
MMAVPTTVLLVIHGIETEMLRVSNSHTWWPLFVGRLNRDEMWSHSCPHTVSVPCGLHGFTHLEFRY